MGPRRDGTGFGGLSEVVNADMQKALIERLTKRLFGAPIIMNVNRGDLLEEIVAMALPPTWTHCSGDYAAYDFEHSVTKKRIQVKQSAAMQSWGKSVRSPVFSIAYKAGRWIGAVWIAERSRNAEIFVFGWHPHDDEAADHRKPEQWLFYVVAEAALPNQTSISLAWLNSLTAPVTWKHLADKIAALD
jgi:hypothetical protein